MDRGLEKVNKDEYAVLISSCSEITEDGLLSHVVQEALDNDLILNAIFKNCKNEALAACRLVSKKWYNNSLKQWRSSVCLTLTSNDGKLPSGFQEFGMSPMVNLETYPFRQCRIVNGLSLTSSGGKWFWNAFGPFLHKLVLDSSKYIDNESWKEIIFEKTPNLKKLTLSKQLPSNKLWNRATGAIIPKILTGHQRNLKILKVSNCKWVTKLPISWKRFLCFFPALKKISIPFSQETLQPEVDLMSLIFNFPQTFNDFLKGVKYTRRQNPSNLAITYLDLIPKHLHNIQNLPYSTLQLFRELNLPLKTLKLGFGQPGENVCQRLIYVYSESLQFLEIQDVVHTGFGKPREDEVPSLSLTQVMPSLKRLKTHGVFLPNLSVLKNCPNLETLIARVYPWEEKHIQRFRKLGDMIKDVNMANDQLLNVTEFQTYFVLENVETVRQLKNLLPNLRVVRAQVNPETFLEVCNSWGNTLDKITLAPWSYIDDEAVEGVLKLQNLKAFHMEDAIGFLDLTKKCQHVYPNITNDLLLRGFMQLRELSYLRILTTSRIGETCQNFIKNKGIHVTITRKTCRCPRNWL